MEMKFTPGPWAVDVARDIRYIHSAAGDIILQFSPLYDGIDNAAAKNECDANARLIAAAPTLLSAARGALAALTQNKTYPADIALAKSTFEGAIKQATQS